MVAFNFLRLAEVLLLGFGDKRLQILFGLRMFRLLFGQLLESGAGHSSSASAAAP